MSSAGGGSVGDGDVCDGVVVGDDDIWGETVLKMVFAVPRLAGEPFVPCDQMNLD